MDKVNRRALVRPLGMRGRCQGALAVQMACTHTAALAVLARLNGGGGSERRVVALASAAARLMRANSGQVETDGESKVWWKRLKKALGTKSSDFVNASLLELQAAAHLPFGGILRAGTIKMIKAGIAKKLVEEDPVLLAPKNKDRLLRKIKSKYECDQRESAHAAASVRPAEG